MCYPIKSPFLHFILFLFFTITHSPLNRTVQIHVPCTACKLKVISLKFMDNLFITVGGQVLALHCVILFSLRRHFRHICWNLIVVFTEDPTNLFSYPRACPDSVLKFLTDIFSSRDTADFFYTSDMMILLEIVLRQLTDLSPGAGVSKTITTLTDCNLKHLQILVKF